MGIQETRVPFKSSEHYNESGTLARRPCSLLAVAMASPKPKHVILTTVEFLVAASTL